MKANYPWLRKSFQLAILLMILLVGCFPMGLDGPETSRSAGRSQLRRGDVRLAAAAQASFEAFLQDWAVEDYPGMYDRLSNLSRDALSFEDFSDTYQEIANQLTLQSDDPAGWLLPNGSGWA